MLPELEQHQKTVREAQQVYAQTMSELADERRSLRDREYEARNTVDRASAMSSDVLAKHRDPLVRWIANNREIGMYGEAVHAIYQILPCTLEEIDDLAYRSSWCGTYTEFREEALEAGVAAYKDADGKPLVLGNRDIPDSEVKPPKEPTE